MKPHSYHGEGIVLGRRNFGEADRILSLFTKDHGRTALLAKGVRRPKSKKRGHIEVFTKVAFEAISGKGIDLMTEAEVREDFKEVRTSLRKVSLAYYFTEVIGRITHENESNSELYDFLVQTFEKLRSTNKLRELRVNFINKLLILMGYWPEGRILENPDRELEKVIEREIYSKKIGKQLSL
jgi:DNA repair protein RecO (recombination protein O)